MIIMFAAFAFVLMFLLAKNEAVMLKEEASMPIEKLLEQYGGAVQRINDLKKADGKKVLSPVIRPKPGKASPLEATADSSSDNGHSDGVESELQNSVSLENGSKSDVCVRLVDICDDLNGEKESDDIDKESAKSGGDDVIKCSSSTSEHNDNGKSSFSETNVNDIKAVPPSSEEKEDVKEESTEDQEKSNCSAIVCYCRFYIFDCICIAD